MTTLADLPRIDALYPTLGEVFDLSPLLVNGFRPVRPGSCWAAFVEANLVILSLGVTGSRWRIVINELPAEVTPPAPLPIFGGIWGGPPILGQALPDGRFTLETPPAEASNQAWLYGLYPRGTV